MTIEKGHNSSNRLSGFEKDKLRKKFGGNKLTGSQMDYGRKLKEKQMKSSHEKALGNVLKGKNIEGKKKH